MDHLTAAAVAAAMAQVPGVAEVHDLHVWAVGPGYAALSPHVVLADQTLSETLAVMQELKRVLVDEFGIQHTTIQFERASCGQGTLACLGPGGHPR